MKRSLSDPARPFVMIALGKLPLETSVSIRCTRKTNPALKELEINQYVLYHLLRMLYHQQHTGTVHDEAFAKFTEEMRSQNKITNFTNKNI